MTRLRYEGKLKRWNAERGFGFITAADGGQDIFVHVSAFARNGRLPTEGEALTFEVEPDRNGKRSAVGVRRPGDPAREAGPRHPEPHRLRNHLPNHVKHSSSRDTSPGFFGKLLGGLLVCALAWYGYSHYTARAAKFGSELPAPPANLFTAKLPVPPDFKCDGRNTCSQMTSCREATLFLQNCPGTQMDGNGDGVPCEQQWCNK